MKNGNRLFVVQTQQYEVTYNLRGFVMPLFFLQQLMVNPQFVNLSIQDMWIV